MRCPKCQTDVPDGHFYCPNCRVSIYGYLPEGGIANGGKLERAGRRLLDLLLLLALIGGGIVLARAIKWKELLNSFNSSAEVSPSIKPEQSLPGRPTKRRAANASTQTQKESGSNTKPSSIEGGSPDLKSNIKNPSTKSAPQPITKPTATPTPKPDSQ